MDSDATLQAVLSEHSAEVVGVALHPTNKYFITASADKSWAFYDLDSMLCMAQVLLPPVLWLLHVVWCVLPWCVVGCVVMLHVPASVFCLSCHVVLSSLVCKSLSSLLVSCCV